MPVGIFNTDHLGQVQDLKKPSFASMLTRLMPNGTAPLFVLSSMLKEERAAQFEHGYFSKTMLFPSLTLTASGATGTATVLDGVSTANLLPNMVGRVQGTGEQIIINSVISPTQVSVTRGAGTVPAQAMSASDTIWIIGTAFEQGSVRPAAIVNNPTRITNFTQIFRNTWAVTDSMRNTLVQAGESNVAENRADCAAYHARDIEFSTFFGQKFQSTRNGQPFYMMDGLVNIITNNAPGNISAAGGTTNFTQLEGFVDPLFDVTTDPKGSGDRIMFCGGQAFRTINNIGRLNGTYDLTQGQTEYGLRFGSFRLTRGNFKIIEHPLFNAFGRSSTLFKMAVILDLAVFGYAYLGDRKTQNKEFNTSGNVAQDNGIDALGGTLTTELTTLLKNPAACGIITNLTAGANG